MFIPVLSDIINKKLLPLTIDFSTLADGALPSPLQGATWAISSGVAVNSPTLGGELLTDPGLEANYTAGKCDTLSKIGTPTLAQSADVHSGSKAQEFTGAAINNAIAWATRAGSAGEWSQFSIWGKRTVGTAGNIQIGISGTNTLPNGSQTIMIDSAAYQQYKVDLISTDTSVVNRRAARTVAASGWDTVIVDDGSHSLLTYSTLYALLPNTQANVVVKVQPSVLIASDGTHIGIVLRSNVDALNCIFVMYSRRLDQTTKANVAVIKKIGTAYTSVLGETQVNIVADAWLEARASGNTVQIFYNDTQVGGDLTISDAELVSNRKHGIFSAGGNSLKGFFVQAA